MSDGMNLVLLMGNLGADPELIQAATGPVLKLRLATKETYFDKNKVKQETTEWHRIAYFGAGAAGLARILQKGSGIRLEGRNHTSSYEKNGEKRYSTEVIAQKISLLPTPKYRDTASTAPPPPSRLLDEDALPPLARTRAPEAPVSLHELPF